MSQKLSRRQFFALGAATVGLALSYPLLIERSIVLIDHYTIPVPRLPSAFEGFTIVQLSDLHLGKWTSAAFLAEVLRRAGQIPADIILNTGDYVHARNTLDEIEQVWPLLAGLRAPLGVYSVLGNHDHWASAVRSLELLERSGQNLRRRVQCFERGGQRLWLAGAGDLWEDHQPIDSLLRAVPPGECCIVAAHNPDSADGDFNAPVDLWICGHSHGGQVVLPYVGPLVLVVNNRTYTSGLKTSAHGQAVFISRGIGTAGVPVRFNCYPQIAVLHLTRPPG
jgi:predicted MPP superfamily phosphohydrolase